MKNNEKPMENKGKQWNITCGASPALMHHWFDHHHYIWHIWVIPFSKRWKTKTNDWKRWKTMENDGKQWKMMKNLTTIILFDILTFSKIWHMLGLLVILSLSLSLSLCVSLSLSSRGRQWKVHVMSFRNMYGYVGLWSIGSDFKGSPVEKL